MSKFVSTLIGAAALTAALGAAQFAVGENLRSSDRSDVLQASAAQSSAVNRLGKRDRPSMVTRDGRSTVTVVSTTADATVASRVVKQNQPRDSKVTPVKSSKRPVACEASASVLTDVAKLMESARCVT